MQARGGLIIAAVLFTLVLEHLGDVKHISPLVETFPAGLPLARTEHQVHIKERVKPVSDIVVPIFFVLVGTAVDVQYFNFFNPQN